MNGLRARIEALREWFEVREVRERWVILVGSGVAVYAFFALTLLNPLLEQRESLAAAMTAVNEELVRLQAEAGSAAEQLGDPSRDDFEARETRLLAELERLDGQLHETNTRLVPPAQARRVLEELLLAERELELVSLEALPPRAIGGPGESVRSGGVRSGGAGSGEGERREEPILYRHDLRLEAEGTFFATLRYLEALEAQGPGLILDELSYVVEEYPRARIVLKVYTLSFSEAWIGV